MRVSRFGTSSRQSPRSPDPTVRGQQPWARLGSGMAGFVFACHRQPRLFFPPFQLSAVGCDIIAHRLGFWLRGHPLRQSQAKVPAKDPPSLGPPPPPLPSASSSSFRSPCASPPLGLLLGRVVVHAPGAHAPVTPTLCPVACAVTAPLLCFSTSLCL